jgi:uncharacterized protein (DUF302 family)
MELDYTVPTEKAFDDAVQAVIDGAASNGFTVQFVHDVSATLESKGFERERVTIIEMCNARHAAKVLEQDVKIGLMLPCPVMVYAEGGHNFISTMKPSLIAAFFPQADLAETAGEVERVILGIIDAAA